MHGHLVSMGMHNWQVKTQWMKTHTQLIGGAEWKSLDSTMTFHSPTKGPLVKRSWGPKPKSQ